jgi:uridine kinase
VKYVIPQQKVADIIVPRGIENYVAMSMPNQTIFRSIDGHADWPD